MLASCSVAAVFAGALIAIPAAVAAPGNDDFANATTIERVDDGVLSNEIHGDNLGATTESGEPQHRDANDAQTAGGSSVWYSFTPAYTGPAEFVACTNMDPSMAPGFVSFNGLVGVYTGASVGALTSVGNNGPTDCDGVAGAPDIKNEFQAEAGTSYHFAVAGDGGAQGNIVARVFQRPHNDDFANADTLVGVQGETTGDNVFASEEPGEPLHGASASPAGSVWYRWTAPMDGRATFDTCGSEAAGELAIYTGSSVDSLHRVGALVNAVTGCGDNAGQHTESIAATSGTTYWIAVDSRADGWGAVTINYKEVKIPETTITAGPTGPTNDPTPTFHFKSSLPGSSFQCHVDSQPFGRCAGPPGSHTPGTPLDDGAHTFTVRAIKDFAFDPTPATRSFTVDTVPPQTTLTAGPSGATHDRTPTFKFASSEPGGGFQCVIRRAGGGGSYAPCSGPGASDTPNVPLAPGSYVFKVRARDKAGNLDPSPSHRSFTVVG